LLSSPEYPPTDNMRKERRKRLFKTIDKYKYTCPNINKNRVFLK
jgi:hypothetical protein